MKNASIKLSLFINYFLFAILLNSVGIVIRKAQEVYGVDEIAAATLEPFKDLSIAIVSFVIASFLPRIGYKKAMLAALALVTVGCVGMYFGNSFEASRLLFACIGTAFALVKVSVYSVIGLVTDDSKSHNSLMSNIEGFFMFGVAAAYFIFPAFYSETDPDAWLDVYLLLAALSALTFLILFFSPFDEGSEIPGSNLKEDFMAMLGLISRTLVIVFVFSAFLFVMIEQGIMTWLPTFNERVLSLGERLGDNMAALLPVSLGVGRFAAGILSKKVSWVWIITGCILCAMIMVVFVLPRVVSADMVEASTFSELPPLAFAFPLVGLFIAPIYPLINSAVLSALPKSLHSPMSGLIIIFSALGGTVGSLLTGALFKNMGADKAFYYTLIPMLLLLIFVFLLKRLTVRESAAA